MRKHEKSFEKKKFQFRKKKFLLRYRYRNWTLVSVPDTKTWFRSYTKCNATQLDLTMLSLSVAKQNTAKTLTKRVAATNLAIFI